MTTNPDADVFPTWINGSLKCQPIPSQALQRNSGIYAGSW